MDILELIGTPIFKKGSKIHIKKKNRGKFTEYCGGKVTQECIDKAKKSNNPTLRKRATFADNARTWKKHQIGGVISQNKPIQKNPIVSQIHKTYTNGNDEIYHNHNVISNIDGGTNYSGIMGDTEYFIRKDNSGYMVDVQGPDMNYQAEQLQSVPNDVITYLRSAKNKTNLETVSKKQKGGRMKKLDIPAMRKDPEFRRDFNLYMHDGYLDALQDSMINRKGGYAQRVSVLGMAIPENGGRPDPHGNGAVGIMGWRGERAVNLPKDFGGQAHHLMVELFENPKGKNWNHGGKGTNVQTGKEMRTLWQNTQNVAQATNAIMKGYVRPEKSEHERRQRLVNIIKRHMK